MVIDTFENLKLQKCVMLEDDDDDDVDEEDKPCDSNSNKFPFFCSFGIDEDEGDIISIPIILIPQQKSVKTDKSGNESSLLGVKFEVQPEGQKIYKEFIEHTYEVEPLKPVRSMKRAVVFRDDYNSFNQGSYSIECSAWGGGNNEFQVYTNQGKNLFSRGGHLYIKPTTFEDIAVNPLTGDVTERLSMATS
ncbi:Hypothetical predicted protein [Mytilus galloprovincialis]|uniref:Uncharacterized protein n=1 Tax=Mytilus galloprovincialis TaxID=29158 RepID=A0A8B6GQE2_MYTGA|nr:Hypothetical predicted protein [Mytilus galloprovincialis]